MLTLPPAQFSSPTLQHEWCVTAGTWWMAREANSRNSFRRPMILPSGRARKGCPRHVGHYRGADCRRCRDFGIAPLREHRGVSR